tara:strand:+ start:1454 stop:2188 length:735 start_codon:yes stop_codon:yes gene_type:complete
MKEYNGVFTVQFTVQELANKLLESYLGEMPMPLIEEVQAVATGQSDFDVSEDVEFNCKHYMKDYQHYERLVESIVDCVENSQDSCATIFNALNGWVKFDVPGLKKIPRREEILKEEVDMAISSYSDSELTHHIQITRQHIYSLEKDGSIDVDKYNEQKEWLQLLLTEWERRHGVQLADNREEILAEEIAEYTDAKLDAEINIVEEKLHKIKERGMLTFAIEQEFDDLNDWGQLLSKEWNSRHNH